MFKENGSFLFQKKQQEEGFALLAVMAVLVVMVILWGLIYKDIVDSKKIKKTAKLKTKLVLLRDHISHYLKDPIAWGYSMNDQNVRRIYTVSDANSGPTNFSYFDCIRFNSLYAVDGKAASGTSYDPSLTDPSPVNGVYIDCNNRSGYMSLYDTTGNLLINHPANNPNTGFTSDGTPCNSPDINKCPFKVVISWKTCCAPMDSLNDFKCTSTQTYCSKPFTVIQATFKLKELIRIQRTFPLSPKNYSVILTK
ncbi:MAG: hypothetical protein D6797_00810 [Bdellovibrio sp.]|nr:MAG: hypothetical protein D6797_00810 [Bdellovibrio sp.]